MLRSPRMTRAAASAGPAERERLLADFIRLCEIESPSKREGAMAKAVRAELEALGLEVEEDDSAAETGSECGNLLARIAGPEAAPTILLCAHLDTVPARCAGGGGAGERRAAKPPRGDPRRGQQGRGGHDPGHRPAAGAGQRAGGGGAAVHHLRGAGAGRREGLRALAPERRAGLRVRPRLADRRAGDRLAHLLPARARSSAAPRPTPGSGPRWAATRSPPRRRRWRRWRSGASTRRRRPTSG